MAASTALHEPSITRIVVPKNGAPQDLEKFKQTVGGWDSQFPDPMVFGKLQICSFPLCTPQPDI